MFERVLVTGGTGFIGSYVVRKLVAAGYRPLVTYRDDSSRPVIPFSNEKVDLADLDITDTDAAESLMSSYRPQAVLHLAGVTGHDDPDGRRCEQLNFAATTRLLKVLENVGVEKVAMLGSAAEYGNQPTPFREDMEARPVSPYGISKAKATAFALEMNAAGGFPVTILRVFTAYGAGQPANMFLSQAVRRALLDRNFKMSDGLQRRDFVFVEDAADAILAAMISSSAVGRVINIGGGMGVPLRTVAERVWELTGADINKLEIGALPKGGDDSLDTEADISLANRLLGWSPGPGILDRTGESGGLNELIAKMRGEITTRRGN